MTQAARSGAMLATAEPCSLWQLIEGRLPVDRARIFLETGDGRIHTYGDLIAVSARFAHTLQALGVAKGDRVAVQSDKSPEAVFLYLACLRAGAIYLPLNTAYGRGELGHFLGDAEPRLAVCRPEVEAEFAQVADAHGVEHTLTLGRDRDGSLIEQAAGRPETFASVATGPDDIAAILYTSGTTGRSKGAMLSHWNLASNALALFEAWGFRQDDVLLHALPMYHTHGLFVAINCVLMAGGSMLFLERFDAGRVLALLPRATVMMGVPTFYVRLLAQPRLTREGCAHMRVFISGSAPLLEETFRAFEERTGQRILERYGMTETGMNTSNPLHGERRGGTVGLPLPGVEARIADEDGRIQPADAVGVLEVRGPNVFKGYWRMPEKTREEFRADGFFITGDLATIGDDGYVTIVGRAKDLIISGGLNVYPKEIESVIDQVPGVVESAVVGLPHPDFGEAVTAVVVREPGATVSEETLIGAVRGELAAFKVPKKVIFIDSLPRNSMGKVQKNLLRDAWVANPR